MKHIIFGGNDRHAPLGGRERPRLAQVVRSASAGSARAPPKDVPPCSSWSEITEVSPERAARIARCAALAPDIVVIHGMPRPIAARRIS